MSYPAGDVRRAAEQIVALCHDPARREAMGRRARALAETEFSLDHLADRFAGLFTP